MSIIKFTIDKTGDILEKIKKKKNMEKKHCILYPPYKNEAGNKHLLKINNKKTFIGGLVVSDMDGSN